MKRLEVWGGVECTVNRVGDAFYRQLDFSGHYGRVDDLRAIAELGITTLRYPALWEDIAPNGVENADWHWTDERLNLLRSLNVAPIVGLLHHGSGPSYTSLVDDAFPEKFAQYAAAVAARYPWVTMWTPINEPLTTARFSALYGLWYPHASDDRSFVRAIINQCKATVLAMREIRRFNPDAQLVQTEDLGKVYSSRALQYQARFENHRRWLTWDLLCGRVTLRHPLRRYLVKFGATPEELDWLTRNACPPNIIGINHYVTSNRYLHQEETWCPRERWGGNAREAYADTEAVRVMTKPVEDVGMLIGESWRRYKLPIAITETHLGCSRDEQLRWIRHVWDAASAAQRRGADVRAVTVWALLGSYDWNSLLTEFNGHYEPGAFDLRSVLPRPTAIAKLVRALCMGDDAYEEFATKTPLFDTPGWWHRDSRLLPACAGTKDEPLSIAPTRVVTRRRSRPLLITGARGTLGRAFARICEHRGIEYRACVREELDIAVNDSIRKVLADVQPWAVINTAGYVRVDEAERDRERCFRENTLGPKQLAEACADQRIPLVTFSSDLVFNGYSKSPYKEQHAVSPLSVYGSSKALAESAVLEAHNEALVIRTSSFFGPWDRHNFLSVMLESLLQKRPFNAASDVTVSPTYVPDLAHAALDLLIDGETGLWHLVNRGAVTWAEFAAQAAQIANADHNHIVPMRWRALGLAAPRPQYSALSSERGLLLPALDNAIERYLDEVKRERYALAS